VKILLLCHNHLRRHVTNQLAGHLPIEIVKMIIVKMAKECQVEQTLVRGIHAAPDLKPVELPKDVPIEESSTYNLY